MCFPYGADSFYADYLDGVVNTLKKENNAIKYVTELYEYKKQRQHRVYNFVFGEVVGKKSVFLIQNIFPTTEEYILEKYVTENKDVEIALNVRNKIIAYSRQVIMKAEQGINIPLYNIIEMEKILLNK